MKGALRTAFDRGGEAGRLLLERDWTGFPPGPPAEWPSELAGAVITVLSARIPMVLRWGDTGCPIPNDAYLTLTGGLGHEADLAAAGACGMVRLERRGFPEEVWLDVSSSPIGTAGATLSIVREVTAQVLAERRLRTLDALGSLPVTDEAELGEQVAQVLGGNPADLPYAALWLDDDTPVACVGAPARAFTSPDAADVCSEPPPAAGGPVHVLPVAGGGTLVAGTSRHLVPDDAYRAFVVAVAERIGQVVTRLRASGQERRRAAELEALDAAKTRFFSDVSHEFRTPLALILGPVEELLADPALPADRLLPVHRNAQRLLKLVNTVLDFSRLESGRQHATFRATDLADYTARLAGTFRSVAERAGLRLTVHTPPLAAPVHVDREMWEKVVLNLLSNAVKFTPAGEISVRLTADDGHAVLAVSDTGVGVAPADRPLLFDRFHRVTGHWSRSHEGTGIGLALVREVAELHGGTVDVADRTGPGSTFTVRIPFGTAHLDPGRIATDDPAGPGELEPRLYVEEAHWWEEAGAGTRPGDSGGVRDARRGRILLADDSADLRDHVARLLRPDWDVTTAADGQDALDLAVREQFDLVLTDVMMPRLDGFGLIRALRADERTRDVPIVVLSARAGEEASVEGLSMGADDYLVKPFSARDLSARVRANLELGQLRRQIISRLRDLVDAAAALNTVPTTAEVLDVGAQHVRAMTSAGRVVVSTPDHRAEVDGGADGTAEPVAVLPLPDTSGGRLGELRVWSGADGTPEPVLLTQLARLIGLRLENARLYEAEHRIAATLQHSLLPQTLPRVPGAIVASRYLAGSSEAEVGGDWFDVIMSPDDQLFLVIGDVVGKGVQAAAGMGQLRNALRAYILEGFDCGDALSRLNRLVDNLGRRQFATVVCVRFDPQTGELHFSSAGHPSPVLAVPGEHGTFLYDSALGPPIGALGDVAYPTLTAHLDPGSRLLMFTDGLVEDRSRGIDGGLAELTADVAKPADHVEDLLDMLLGKAARHTRRDDIALLALQATEPREFVLRLPADATRLSVLRRRLDDFLTAHGVPESDIFDLIVAVSEAAANAIEHPVEPVEPVITVEASLQPGAVLVTVRDTGRWRPSTSAGFRGRGLALIGALAELSVARSAAGTAVTLRRPVSLPAGS